MFAKGSLVYSFSLVSYAPTKYVCRGRGVRGVWVWHIVWLRVECVKRKKRGKDIIRNKA
jgi:hypothetical protein